MRTLRQVLRFSELITCGSAHTHPRPRNDIKERTDPISFSLPLEHRVLMAHASDMEAVNSQNSQGVGVGQASERMYSSFSEHYSFKS